MDPLHLLSKDIQSLDDWRVDISPVVHADRADCLELEVNGINFLLTRTSDWADGIVVTAELGHVVATEPAPLLDVMALNMDHALGGKPIFGVDWRDGNAVFTCVQRIAMPLCNAHLLATQIQQVADLSAEWMTAGWLSTLEPHARE